MASRQVVRTDSSLQNGQAIQRSYIAQIEDEFAQFFSNLIAQMDNIANSTENTSANRIQATKEMRYLLVEQRKLLAEIEEKQDAQQLENKTTNLRSMITTNPKKALQYVDEEIGKLNSIREVISNMIKPDLADVAAKLLTIPDDQEPF